MDDGGVDAVVGEVLGDDALVRGGDRLALQVRELVADGAGLGGEPEGGACEAQREDLLGVGAGVDQQVTAGDADVELPGGDVDRDVAGAEVEELDLVLRVDDAQFLGLAALLVAGLMQHLRRRAGQ